MKTSTTLLMISYNAPLMISYNARLMLEQGVHLSGSTLKEYLNLSAERDKLLDDAQNLEAAFVNYYHASADKLVKKEREARLNELAAKVAESGMAAKIGEALAKVLGKWHAPFSAPLTLLKLWLDEIRTWAPLSLGGKSYKKMIDAWKMGGFAGAEEFLERKNPTPFRKASAWTALGRHLQRKRRYRDMVEAAKRAYEIDPRPFRIKWYAFRLYEAGDVVGADIALDFLADKIAFTDSEEKARTEIALMANEERSIILHAIMGKALEMTRAGETKIDWDALEEEGSVRELDNYYLEICKRKGPEACLKALLHTQKNKAPFVAMRLIKIARAMREIDAEKEYELMKLAARVYPAPANLRAFFWVAQRSRHLMEAVKTIRFYARRVSHLSSDMELDALEKMYSSQTYSLGVLYKAKRDRKIPRAEPSPKRVVYVLHNSLPYSSGGYATRSHGVAVGLRDAGYDVRVVTRPGYPLDIVADMSEADMPAEPDIIDGVPYYRILSPMRRGLSVREYAEGAAESLQNFIVELNPEIVIAASNHTTAVPALIAAKRLGIPFIYEVRGLWEITRISREPTFEASPQFHVNKTFEAEVCKRANHVLTLTEGLKNELIDRGVKDDKISLAPNSCDPERFTPRARDATLAARLNIPGDAPVIGYVGTFVIYEGLENLAEACAILKKSGREFRLLLVGNENASSGERGPITEEIIQIAQDNDFADWLILPGRVPYEEVESYYSLIDIAPFPRKPWPVCEIVSPMKPLEAMAMEKAPLVSSVGALSEMVRDGETGLIFAKGDVADMALKLAYLIDNPEERRRMGKNARQFVRENRTWQIVCEKISDKIREVLEPEPEEDAGEGGESEREVDEVAVGE